MQVCFSFLLLFPLGGEAKRHPGGIVDAAGKASKQEPVTMVEHNNRTWKIKTRKKSGQDYQKIKTRKKPGQDYQKIKTRKKSGQDYQDDDKKPFGNIIYHMIQ